MPFSEIHLENMLKLTRMGAVVMPASPGFYHHPKTVEDLVDFVVARIMAHLDIEHRLIPFWEKYADALLTTSTFPGFAFPRSSGPD